MTIKTSLDFKKTHGFLRGAGMNMLYDDAAAATKAGQMGEFDIQVDAGTITFESEHVPCDTPGHRPWARNNVRNWVYAGIFLCCGLLAAGGTSCTSPPESIPGSAKNNAFALGQIDPAEVVRVVVYLDDRYLTSVADLERHPAVEVTQEGTRELLTILSGPQAPFELTDDTKPRLFGAIRAFLADGTSLYLSYHMRGHECLVQPPTFTKFVRRHPEGFAEWLTKYVYTAGRSAEAEKGAVPAGAAGK
jgi:hypothetical protein